MKARLAWLVGGLILIAGSATAQASAPSVDSAAVLTVPRAGKVDLNRLKWMAGCWRAQLDKETVVEENWTHPAENLLLSTTRYLKKDRATSFEFSKIEAKDSTVTFSASTEGKAFDSYTLKTLVDEFVAFENKTKTFPQRIIYRLGADGYLIPRNEGDGQTSVEVRMRRVKCAGE